jgi:membrane protein insertase Oxa1/YidC/SpoIIIJ
MNSKFFLFALYTLTLILLVQYFFPTTKNTPMDTGILLSIKDDTLVIPNIPKIELVNSTNTGFLINPCQDIKFSANSQSITDLAALAPSFCAELSIEPNTTHTLSVDALASLFIAKPAEYIMTLATPLGERTLVFEIEEPGAFRSLLTATVYNPIYNLFVALLTFLPGHPLGWAIVIITLIIRLILLVPQHHMLQSQKKLQVIQPKIKELQKKYKDDQAKLGMEMLELYKKE